MRWLNQKLWARMFGNVVGVSAWLACGASCRGTSSDVSASTQACELRYLSSFGQISPTELAESLGYLAPCKLKWQGQVLGGPESIQAVSTGDVDYGGAATGSVIKLIGAGAPITQVITTNGVDDLTWGGYFVLEGSPIRGPRDLIGKKLAINTLGAHAEFVIREYLTRGGLTKQEIKAVTLVVTPPVNGEQTLRLGQVDLAALSGVMRDRATSRGGLRPLFTDRGLFGNFNSSTMVVRKDTLAKRPEHIRRLIDGTARAIEWARTTPQAQVREHLAHLFATRGRGEAPALAQHWHSIGIRTPGGLIEDRDMQMWIDWLEREGDLPKGKLPRASELYTNALNPYRPGATPGTSVANLR
ncbi:MAG: ABC transporter substrate-binding protein [Polyangiales bacterium]